MTGRRWLILGVVLCAGLMLAPAALAGPPVPLGVTDTEIHIGQWGPQTGPAAPWGAVARGTGVYFQMINDEGGINGRKIVYHMFDDQYNPAKTKAGVKELQEKEPGIFAWSCGVGTATGMAVKGYLHERGIPWVGPAAGSLLWITPPEKNLFAVYPLYYDEVRVLDRYLVEKMGQKKIAFLYVNDEYGKNGLRGSRKQLAKYGLKHVIEVPVGRADRDLKSHVMRLKKSGADTVVMWVNPTHAVITLKTAAAMKFSPQWVTSSTLSDAPLMMHITGGLWKNIVYGNFLDPVGLETPLMNKYRAAYKKYAQKGERWGVFFLAGFGFAEPLVEGLKRAGRDLTRENFIMAMETIKTFKGTMGLISYSETERQGQKQVYISKTDPTGTKVIKLTDWEWAED